MGGVVERYINLSVQLIANMVLFCPVLPPLSPPQILYYDKNPGISYEFILPNYIPFKPLQVARSKQKHVTSVSSADPGSNRQDKSRDTGDNSALSTSSDTSSDTSSANRQTPRNIRVKTAPSRREESQFGGEYYTGNQVGHLSAKWKMSAVFWT